MTDGKTSLDQIVRGLDGVTPGPYEGRHVHGGIPTDCVDYGVVSLSAGKETCRVWKLEDAAHIARCSPDAIREIAAYVRDLEERLAKAAEALERQGDNMAFIINHATLPDQWLDKFSRELDEDRATLSQIRSEK